MSGIGWPGRIIVATAGSLTTRSTVIPQNAAMPAVIIAERDKLRAAGDQESKLVADDIDRQLAGPNQPWNEFIQQEINKMKARGEDPLEGQAKDR